MPVYKITESRSFTRTYTVEAADAETAVEERDDPDRWADEYEDDEAGIDTEVVAVEDADGNPVGEWVSYDQYGNQRDGEPTYELAAMHGYPQWVTTEPDEDDDEKESA
jgi:hypothetical protein